MAKKTKKQEEKSGASQAELLSQVAQLEKELYELRDELSTQKKLDKPHLLKQKKKEKARALTLLTKLQRQEGKGA